MQIKTGPTTNPQGIPYDYIVIIDSGSKGSRVFIYNWPNPQTLLEKGISQGHLPNVSTEHNWHHKIKPGISSFNLSPQKVGKHHIKQLLKVAKTVVPRSQHFRTPIFVHSTAGMRLLPPTEQQDILDQICTYLQRKSPFYIPDCSTHVNVLDGDVEGIYGWISVNALAGALDHPELHAHGKNHTTYGLLDMGGASTQVVFQPNVTEADEHRNNLYEIELRHVPTPQEPGARLSYSVYSDSFLGFGMYQAHNRYLAYLVEAFTAQHNLQLVGNPRIRMPITDPCLPKGYTTNTVVEGTAISLVGGSDFESCLRNIFPVLANSTYAANTPQSKSHNCNQHLGGTEMSSCLLNDLIPSFDFDVNHFFGVSGYWDAINGLLGGIHPENYDYHLIYNKTNVVCDSHFSRLMDLNENNPRMDEDDLAQLCFKSSWILNFLYLGLGFPRYGIDKRRENENSNNKESKRENENKIEKEDEGDESYAGFAAFHSSLRLVEEFNGQPFSWTLGRAILYANDEYVQAYNNISDTPVKRPGFYYSASESIFHYGAENGAPPRPRINLATVEYPSQGTFVEEHNESKWYIKPHRWYGISIFAVLVVFIAFLMIGEKGRRRIREKVTGFGGRWRWRVFEYEPIELGDL